MTFYKFILTNLKRDLYLLARLNPPWNRSPQRTVRTVYLVPRGWALTICKENGFKSGLDAVKDGKADPHVFCYAPTHPTQENSPVDAIYIPLIVLLKAEETSEQAARAFHPALFEYLATEAHDPTVITIEQDKQPAVPPVQRSRRRIELPKHDDEPRQVSVEAITQTPELPEPARFIATQQLRTEIPTYIGYQLKNCPDYDEKTMAKVLMCVWGEMATMRLGTHDIDDMADEGHPVVDISVERRPGGWALIVTSEWGMDSDGIVYITDAGRCFQTPNCYGTDTFPRIDKVSDIEGYERFMPGGKPDAIA